jgi:hypothetical protein
MVTINYARIAKITPEDYLWLRRSLSDCVEGQMATGRTPFTNQKFGEETAKAAAADFEALVLEEDPTFDTTHRVRDIVLNYYALFAEAYGDIHLLTRYLWVDERVAKFTPEQIAEARTLLILP